MSPAAGPTDSKEQPVVVVVGPTGAGKTSVALELAQQVGGEVVSADSQQVYVGMDIGTGKATIAERNRVRHHLIDVLAPDETMTAARFVELADHAIASARERGLPVIVAGGTGLYVRALLRGIFDGPPADQSFRDACAVEAAEAGSPAQLWQRLEQLDPDSAKRINVNDLIRITRALEVHALTGVTMSEHQRNHDHRTVPLRYRARIIGLAPERELLYQRIDTRVDAMMAAGLLDEVSNLRAAGYGAELRSQAAIGYAELHAHLDTRWDLVEAVRLIKRNSRRYARRQLSWYRRDDSVSWHVEPSRVDFSGLGRYLRGD